MAFRIKDKFNNPTVRRLAGNFFSLSILQGVNYLLPLITLPYLTRVLGVEVFGLVMFAQAFAQYFVMLTDYGFNLTATRDISRNRHDTAEVSKIFSGVLILKSMLFLIGLLLVMIVTFSFTRFERDWPIYLISYGIVLGQTPLTLWLFQGMEKMKWVTILHIVARSIFTVLIFVLVRSADDYLLVPALNGFGYLIASAISLLVAVRLFKMRLVWPGLTRLKQLLQEGWYVFVGMLGSSATTLNVTFLLGLLTTNTVVGYYAPLEKLARAIAGLIRPLSQTIFPHLANMSRESLKSAYRLSRRIALFSSGGMLLVSGILIVVANPVVNLLFGFDTQEVDLILRLLALHPVTFSIINLFCNQNMILFSFHRAYSVFYVAAATFSAAISFILIPIFGGIGAALVVLTTDLLVIALMTGYLRRKVAVLA